MTNGKYKLLDNDTIYFLGIKLYKIEALKDFGNVKKGDKGGYVQNERNLSAFDRAWVYDDAWVYGDACVSDSARVYGDARVSDNAWVCGRAWVYGSARVYGNAWVYSNASVSGNAQVYGNAHVCGDASISGNASVSGNARIYSGALIDNDKALITISPIGSEDGKLTAYKNSEGGITVTRGCFRGTLEEFEKAVEETHGDNKHAKTYKLAIELIKSRLEA